MPDHATSLTTALIRAIGGLTLALLLGASSFGSPDISLSRLPEVPGGADIAPADDDSVPRASGPGENWLISERLVASHSGPWFWQPLPDGLIYQSYLAGVKEPRFAAAWVYDRELGGIWDIALGGRVGLLRFGTEDRLHADGWQLDLEGAAFPRLDLEESLDLMAVDYRFGMPLTYGQGPYQTKFGYYHLSSHLGDEIILKHPGEYERINYSRNALVWGNSYYIMRNLRMYGEAAWAFTVDGGSEPWEFQFGLDYSPPGPTGMRAVPFFGINGHLREELAFGGNLSVQTGWLWRGETGHLFRIGMQYYNGKSDQYEFFNQFENKVGFGIWYDY